MILLLLLFFLVLMIDWSSIKQEPSDTGKNIALFLTLFLAAFTLAVLQHFKVEIPSVMSFLDHWMRSIGLTY